MQANNQNNNGHGNHHIQPNVTEDQSNDCKEAQKNQNSRITDGAVENDEWVVAEEVEEEPTEEDDQEDDHGNWVPQEAEKQNEECHHDVVDSEVGEVSFDADRDFSGSIRTGE